MDRVNVTLDRWTKYPGGVYDNRPTKAVEALPKHATDGFSLQDVDDVVLRDCGVTWGEHIATRGEDVGQVRTSGVRVERFTPRTTVVISDPPMVGR